MGQWSFKSKGNDAYYEGHMFPLYVMEQLEFWPEKHIRQRVWVSLDYQASFSDRRIQHVNYKEKY